MVRVLAFYFIIFVLTFAQADQDLTTAVRAGDLNQLEYLLSLGYNVNQINSDGLNPLIEAVNASNIEMVITLLDSGADVNARVNGLEEGSSVIHNAVKYSDTEILKILISYGGDISGALNGLAYVSRQDQGAAEIAQVLLESGAFLDEATYFYDLFNDRLITDYYPCILENIYNEFKQEYCHGVPAVISEYLNSYSNYNFKYSTLAFAAAMAGSDKVQAMIDSGLDPNEKIWRTAGNAIFAAQTTNPLEIALIKHNIAAVRTLIANGAYLDNVRLDILRIAALDDNLSEVLQEYGLDSEFLKTWYLDDHQPCQNPVSSNATISFILDDGERRDKEIITTIFEPRGIQGNLAVVAGYIGKRQYMNAQELLALQASGWEISSHGYYHQDLSSLDRLELEHELIDSQRQLRSYGFKIKTLIYPFGSYNDLVKQTSQQAYSSAFAGGYSLNSINSDLYALGRYNINNNQAFKFYQNLVNKADREGNWLVFALHSSYDLGWEQRQNLDQLLDYICKKGIEILPTNQALIKLGLN